MSDIFARDAIISVPENILFKKYRWGGTKLKWESSGAFGLTLSVLIFCNTKFTKADGISNTCDS